jgi:predicted TIM-barrel fold metal-dependent hydrolase
MTEHPKNHDWLALTSEAPLEPGLPICDPHHHLWDRRPGRVAERYLLDEILEDVGAGHNVVSTVFIECGAMFKPDGPDVLRPVGETEFVNGIAAMSASGLYGKTRIAAGIVGTASLRLGAVVGAMLDAQIAAGGGRFRGIRLGAAWDPDPSIPNHRTEPPEHLFLRDDFRAGLSSRRAT